MKSTDEVWNHIGQILSAEFTELFRYYLMTKYFQWNAEFYEKIGDIAMGSP